MNSRDCGDPLRGELAALVVLPITDPIKLDIHCDESSQTQHRFIVIGALCCRSDITPAFTELIDETIAPHGGTSELKWGKIKRKNLPMYEAVMGDVFKAIAKRLLSYHCLVIDSSKANHAAFNDGDREIGFNKYLFTLLYKFARVYRSNTHFFVDLDDRTTQHTPEKMRSMLNARVAREMKLGYSPYRSVRFVTSHKSRMIQVADVLTGAVAYHTNRNYLRRDASDHKKAFAEHVRKLSGLGSLGIATSYSAAQRGIDIWHLDWDAKKR